MGKGRGRLRKKEKKMVLNCRERGSAESKIERLKLIIEPAQKA